jgi:glycosyltransferase involved in cell wall biosynthesis
VIVFGRLAQAHVPPEKSVPLDFSNVRLIGAPDFVGPVQYLKCRRRIMRAAREALSQADSILLRGANPTGMPIYYLNRDTGRPYGIEVIGDPHESLARGSVRHPLRPYFRWLYTREQRRVCYDAYVAAYVTAQSLQRRYPAGPGRWATHYSDVVIPPNGFRDSAQAVYNGVGPFRLASIGTMSVMAKAFDVLIAAVAQAVNAGCDLELSIIGDGQHLPELRQLAQRLGVEQRVRFCGTLPPGGPIFAELDRAHLFVLVSRTEGLPRAMVEAMARGLPCVGTAVGGIPELLAAEDLVPPDNVRALAERLIELARQPERLAAMSRRNVQTAADYSEERLRDRRIECYRRLRAGTEEWLRQREKRQVPNEEHLVNRSI